MTPAGSLCQRCARVRVVRNARGSTFYQCLAGAAPVYPPQPVVACAAFRAAAAPEKVEPENG